MFKATIIANATGQIRELCSKLVQKGFDCSIISHGEESVEQIVEQPPDFVLIVIDSYPAGPLTQHGVQTIKQQCDLPVIALLTRQSLEVLDTVIGIDDFIIEPWDSTEVAIRAKRVLWKASNIDSEDLIKHGDLVIDLAKCEVSLSGKLIELTFKEYELLRFMAGNEGKVFTRDALLNRIWGYDYYGGDRTVDVHITRLRSKLEDSTHTFIETVRNVGYKFKFNL